MSALCHLADIAQRKDLISLSAKRSRRRIVTRKQRCCESAQAELFAPLRELAHAVHRCHRLGQSRHCGLRAVSARGGGDGDRRGAGAVSGWQGSQPGPGRAPPWRRRGAGRSGGEGRGGRRGAGLVARGRCRSLRRGGGGRRCDRRRADYRRGERREPIVVAAGANRHLASEILQVPAGDALIGEVLAPLDAVARAVVEFGGFTCVNLAPAKEVDDAVLRGADLIVVNESEAAWYGERLALREGLVATTFGASGAALVQGGEEVARVSSLRVEAVDTTGAGDAFTAALTLALVEGQSLAETLRFACAAGAAATQHRGAQPSLPTRDEVRRILRDTETR